VHRRARLLLGHVRVELSIFFNVSYYELPVWFVY
jgi:hypothetical protein